MLANIVPQSLHPPKGEAWSWQDQVWMLQGIMFMVFIVLAIIAGATWALLVLPSPFQSMAFLMAMATAWAMVCATSLLLVPMLMINCMGWQYRRRAEKRWVKELAMSVEGVDARNVAGWQDGYFPVLLEQYCREQEEEKKAQGL